MHRGLDGRLYMLDLARSMPPEDPDVSMHTYTYTLQSTTLCIVLCAEYYAHHMVTTAVCSIGVCCKVALATDACH
jgi:hypothetical protein